MDPIDVVVTGGGVVGTAVAWRAAKAGLEVVVVDPEAGDAASLVAAGMLAPVTDEPSGEANLFRLNLLALRRFPAVVAELEEAAGQRVGLRREGTLVVACDPGDCVALQQVVGYHRSAGLDAEELDSRECRKLEPFLAPHVQGGVRLAGVWSVDNRRYVAALRSAALAAGAQMACGHVAEVSIGCQGFWSVGMADGKVIISRQVVVAAGAWTGSINGLPNRLRAVIRPVKGQLLRLRDAGGLARPSGAPVITHTIRAIVRGRDVYLVPRVDGELVIGATQEERGYDRTVTAGAMHRLLRDAISVLPAISELVLAETCAGLRPGTPDNGPVVGPVTDTGPGLVIAGGHYRDGILTSATTADAVLAYLTGQRPPTEWDPFIPGRFE